MITVTGKESDYAIMKQVQQLRLMAPDMAVVTLDASTDFSKLAVDETLYLVGHGDSGSGDVRGIARADLLSWLKHDKTGVPPKFGGIVILSCYSGLQPKAPQPSLAGYLAEELRGKTAAGTTVEGANGYSYGTPEFRNTERSSVLPMELSAFYFAGSPSVKANQWLKHKPTHTDGVLKDKLNITVDISKTISDNLAPLQQPQRSTTDIAAECLADFIQQAPAIEAELSSIIQGKIPGSSVADKAEYLVTHTTDQNVINWNTAIDKQYALFSSFYLWALPWAAFTTVTIL